METPEEEAARLAKMQTLSEECKGLEEAFAKMNPPSEYCASRVVVCLAFL